MVSRQAAQFLIVRVGQQVQAPLSHEFSTCSWELERPFQELAQGLSLLPSFPGAYLGVAVDKDLRSQNHELLIGHRGSIQSIEFIFYFRLSEIGDHTVAGDAES